MKIYNSYIYIYIQYGLGNGIPGRGDSKSKGSGAGTCLVFSRNKKKASVFREEQAGRKVVGGDLRETNRTKSCRAFQTLVKALGFTLYNGKSLEGFEQSSDIF